ncbi:kinase-like protein [Xylariaceae sp. FL0255]|nr:kinase-like protein [Xylariaceae sp. FL0255]
MDALRSKIKALRRKNAMQHTYIPELLLESVMTIDIVRKALSDSDVPSYQREETVNRILPGALKIFAILLLLNLQDQLAKFIESDQFHDAKLPFATSILTEDIKLENESAKDFEEKQWELIAPTFLRATLHRRLGRNAVLPFTESKRIGKGGFGTVYEVAIDVDHQVLGDGFSRVVARKDFEAETSHLKELENLAVLNHLKHPNIVELLSSFTHDGKHSLLFPLAKDGSLQDLLTTQRSRTRFQSDQSLLVALAALSSAVEHVHNFSQSALNLELIGCHHDLRPRNVLVSEGRFILADFGLSTLKSLSQNSQTPFKNGTDDYLAPECEDWDASFQGGVVHRSADIWSLGCIVAEIATYLVFGHQGVSAFQKRRECKVRAWILHQFHEGPSRPSEAVKQWLDLLEHSGTKAVAMLVHLVRQTLVLDQKARPGAAEMTQKLRFAALHEVSATIDRLFDQVRDKYPSLDMFLEHMRFNAWKHAFGLSNGSNEQSSVETHNYNGMVRYDGIFGHLAQLSADLTARLSQEVEDQHHDYSALMSLNDDLHSYLSPEKTKISQEYFMITVLDHSAEPVRDLGTDVKCANLSHEIRVRANIKHISALLADSLISSLTVPQVDPTTFGPLKKLGDHSYGQINDGTTRRRMWVEWREYKNQGADKETIRKLYERAAQAAELLSQDKPASFRTLTCSGFFHQPQKASFGLIYNFPDWASSTEPLSLRDALGLRVDGRGWTPDLDDRFKLASTLAASVFEFHTVSWLHKSLNSENIVFFPRPDDANTTVPDGITDNLLRSIQISLHPRRLDLSKPFLVGFHHSRPDGSMVYTSGLAQSTLRQYQHPAYLKGGMGYRLEYDYYSLGIVLLEIGFWTPISEITAGWKGTYEEQRQQLINRRVPRLRQHMGREFAEAVRFCLEGSQPVGVKVAEESIKEADERLAKLKLEFGRRVVAPLSKYFV